MKSLRGILSVVLCGAGLSTATAGCSGERTPQPSATIVRLEQSASRGDSVFASDALAMARQIGSTQSPAGRQLARNALATLAKHPVQRELVESDDIHARLELTIYLVNGADSSDAERRASLLQISTAMGAMRQELAEPFQWRPVTLDNVALAPIADPRERAEHLAAVRAKRVNDVLNNRYNSRHTELRDAMQVLELVVPRYMADTLQPDERRGSFARRCMATARLTSEERAVVEGR